MNSQYLNLEQDLLRGHLSRCRLKPLPYIYRLQEARQAAQGEMLEEVEQAKREAELKLADLEKIMVPSGH